MNVLLDGLRRHRYAVILLLFLLVVLFAVWNGSSPSNDPRIEAIRQQGYPVSLVEVDAWYPAVPDAENAAYLYTNAFTLLSTNNTGSPTRFTDSRWLPNRGEALSATNRQALVETLTADRAALEKFYAVPLSTRSRYPIEFKNGFNMMIPHLSRIKVGIGLLTAEALLAAADGDASKSTRAFLAAGHLAELIAQEPLVISFLVHNASWATLLPRLERALGAAKFSEKQLAALQQMVEEAEQPRGLARGLAEERAIGIAAFTDQGMQTGFFSQNAAAATPDHQATFKAHFFRTLYQSTGILKRDKAYFLDSLGAQIAAAEKPYPERFAEVGRLAPLNTNVPSRFWLISRMLLPSLQAMIGRDAEHTTRIRLAIAGLAVERYRGAHQDKLPSSLQDLVPDCLSAVPLDPYDGQPLRFKCQGRSFGVYSVGPDRRDDGGVNWDSKALQVPQDVAFIVVH